MNDVDVTPLSSFGQVPAGWLWGVATAAHQIEGGNANNDWWRFEHRPDTTAAEPSGDACDSWNRWAEDLDLVKGMGLDAYRFSLEWSRIEPSEGEFSDEAIGRYREMLVGVHARGMKSCVTLHHFTTPVWLADNGGIDAPDFIERFERYCRVVAEGLGDLIDMAFTFNEPNVVAVEGYLTGGWPPHIVGDLDAYERVTDAFVSAHRAGVAALKAGPGNFPVGLTLALPDAVFHPDGTYEGPGVRMADLPTDGPVGRLVRLMAGAYLEAAKGDDFIGIQTYSETHFGPDGMPIRIPDHERQTQMAWSFTPEALAASVRHAARVTGVPVIVTENGVATADDAERIEYVSRALRSLRAVMNDGVDVRGYFYWSLLDNFEWAEGYRPLFGLVSCDRTTFVRTPKPSSAWYASVVASSR